ncbi:paired amphipathic helix protein Sin3-like 5 isoform X2 [Ananas comosus]|uniref:Paired amphipathic helix protein Sin3-like 5 isoform X2 n=1 Tax=Ananas comosus TaxID=4615 RepID=A0A6P5GJA0_ANACO|nr:paired amphipathic helix protein Sin3-like 5 isoform X2 [Ananas comosus]
MKIEDAAIDDHNGVSLPVSKYFKTLEKELHNEPENFHRFVLLLKDFRNKSIDHVGILLNLKELLKHKLHLFHGFKELLNEVDCVERKQTKAELAFLYVCKVKDHFHNDQRFQIFTEIFTKFTMNKKTKVEVYQEMRELLGSHKELFEEFRKFYDAAPETMVPETMPLPTEPSGATLKNQDGREDCSKEDQECNESNIGHKKANLVEPKSSSKRKRMQTGDIIMANHQQEGGSIEPDVRMGYVNNEMDRVDKAKSCQGDKAPVAVDEIVPEANKAPIADDKIVPEVDKAPVADDEIVPEPPVSEGDDSAQNDDSVAANGSCGRSVRLVDQYEQELFKAEDDRFEIDVLRNLVASTAMRTADLLKKISNKTVEQRPLRLEDHFTQKCLWCIEEMYGDYSLEVKEALQEDPAKVLPVILARLEKKKEEISILKSHFDTIWRVSSERNYKLSRHLQRTKLRLQRTRPSIRT